MGHHNRYYRIDTKNVTAAVARLAPRLRGRLLEVGCGESPYRALVGPHIAWYVGSDISALSGHPDVLADGARLPFRGGAFDSVLCTQVLEHVPEPLAVLKEITRVLSPGGVAMISVPLNSGVHMAPHDFMRFTEFALRDLAVRAGLEVTLVEERGGRIANAAQALLLIFEDDRMPRRNVWAALARRAIGVFCFVVEHAGLFLDRRFPKTGSPLGYVLLAMKPR
jgi:SAM-dependent methyltransferase